MRYADKKKSNRSFFHQLRECNSKTNEPILPGFELFREFIDVHHNCKFQEDPIKSEKKVKAGRSLFTVILFSCVKPLRPRFVRCYSYT